MEINASRIILTPIQEVDIQHVHLLNSHEEVAKFNTIGIPDNYQTTFELHRPMLDHKTVKGWTIKEKETKVFMGILGMRLAPERFKSGEIHYSLLPNYWGQGYATEAVQYFLKYTFSILKMHRIEAGCAVNNLGSIRVLEKAGFVREGRKRKVLPLKVGWTDNYEYAILNQDFTTISTNSNTV